DAATGCSAATMPCGAGAVRFVTTRRDWIMGSSRKRDASGPKGVLRDVDDDVVLHVNAPARRIGPRLVRLALLHRGPELARELFHVARFGDPGERRAPQGHDLLGGCSPAGPAGGLLGRDVPRVVPPGVLGGGSRRSSTPSCCPSGAARRSWARARSR